ncbi:MAG: 30S ribosome-binding factor RbfA [SAR202 cluster bacterium]|jgi:ribosome-binding factor A|nr:30S ribosome-binding factor RbfA [SAR202 cluster bacterium]MDP7104209.1 30S ribosome-binding factor RbfA [SAR202 cluster bacterium]MDP7226092.1 30S ribosome-binding factor RbfA [SAR202 cluster bacterium]MDP7412875.1 30S ribosome-binding factor RbfA [SAR202 cluster bacterium]HJO81248.1 30S ribosome-binding factor RbfA [SAR202 cluster bacterium]|tara:strand:- start:586 stop:975 length:390 start_codon:yes stop_codon:yes gene_type:complete
MSRRSEQVSALLRREISQIIQTGVKDPRVSGMVSVMRVETTTDISFAKVYISVYGDESDKRGTLKALKSATGFIRGELLHRLSIRAIPALRFILDETLEQGNEILALIDSLDIPPEEPEDQEAEGAAGS